MPLLAKNVTHLVLAIAAILILGTVVLIAIAIARRLQRDSHFRRLDALRQEYGPTLADLLTGQLDYRAGLETLRRIGGWNRLYWLKRLCLDTAPTPAQLPILRRLSEDLGLVEAWQRDLGGGFHEESFRDSLSRPGGLLRRIGPLSFLVRADSAENLRLVRHTASWPLLVEALDDPHPDVQKVAARALACLREPESFPALVAELHAKVAAPASTQLSLRSVKAALVSFPLRQAVDLLPSLQHSHPRVRFLATDIIREMVEREASSRADFVLAPNVFPPELTEIFLARLWWDENPDVRARAAPVISYLPKGAHSRTLPTTVVLIALLNDSQWFVRLHAVRALAKPRYAAKASEIAERLTDPNWRVREAAVRTLVMLGHEGLDRLLEHLVSTDDRYSQEQIVEEMGRTGVIHTLLADYANGSGARVGRAIDKLVSMGKTSHLMAILQNGAAEPVRARFLEDFGHHPDPQIQDWVKATAKD